MRRGRNLVAIGLLTGALILPSIRNAEPQESPPDLRMLLNLDLFKPSPPKDSRKEQDQETSGSMLDQIRALNAMGYLGTTANNLGPRGAQNAGDAPALSNPPPPREPSRDSEGPQ
jgi:hypothetical protein